jgi:hypothetical protein
LETPVEGKTLLCEALAILLEVELHVIELEGGTEVRGKVFNQGAKRVMAIYLNDKGGFHVIGNLHQKSTTPRRPVSSSHQPRVLN